LYTKILIEDEEKEYPAYRIEKRKKQSFVKIMHICEGGSKNNSNKKEKIIRIGVKIGNQPQECSPKIGRRENSLKSFIAS
jgi:hypothetical protein